jgi:hypothetical protein
VTTVGESYHQHVTRHSHVGGGAEHDHMKMAVAACEGKGEVSAPKAFIEGLAPLAMMQYESLAPVRPESEDVGMITFYEAVMG